MSFQKILKDSFKLTFAGRIDRTVYWVGNTIWDGFIIGLMFGISRTINMTSELQKGAAGTLMVLTLVLYWLFTLSLSVRRWHDRNKSGWWQLVMFVPVIGPFWSLAECGFQAGTRGENNFGEPYKSDS